MQCSSENHESDSQKKSQIFDRFTKKPINSFANHPINQSNLIHSNPYSKINQSISHFAPILINNGKSNKSVKSQLDFFPLSPQLTPISRPVNQSINSSPPVSAFKLDRELDDKSHTEKGQGVNHQSPLDFSPNQSSSINPSADSADSTMQRVHREKSIRSPMRTRLSRSPVQPANQSNAFLSQPLFSPAGEPITVETKPAQSLILSASDHRSQSFNKELDESINDVSFVKLDSSPTSYQSTNESTNESTNLSFTPSKVDHLLKEVDSALFGQESLADELAQARKEDEIVSSPVPGLKFNQSIGQLLDDDVSDDLSHSEPVVQLEEPETIFTETSTLSATSDQSVSQSTSEIRDDDIHIVGKQVPVRFVIPPADVMRDDSKQADIAEAVESISQMFSESDKVDDNIVSSSMTDESSLNGSSALSPSFEVHKIPVGTVRTYHLTSAPLVMTDRPLRSEAMDDSNNRAETQSSVPAPVDKLDAESEQSNVVSPIADRTTIQVPPPTPIAQSTTPVFDEPLASPGANESFPVDSSCPSVDQSLIDKRDSTTSVDGQITDDTVKESKNETSSGSPTYANRKMSDTLPFFGERAASGDLVFKETHTPSLNQSHPDSPVLESVDAPRTIPPSVSHKELRESLLPVLSPVLELLSVDVPNEVGAVSPQALAARRLLQVELAKSPVVEPLVDARLNDIFPILATKSPAKRSRKSKKRRTTPSPFSLLEDKGSEPPVSQNSLVEDPSAENNVGVSPTDTSKQGVSDLPEASEELHEISRQHDDKNEESPSEQIHDIANEPLASDTSFAHSKSEQDIDQLSIDAQRENEPRLYSFPQLSSYNPQSEWSPDVEREKTENRDTQDKFYNDKEDTHDNALFGLDTVTDEPKTDVTNKLSSLPPKSSTQDEEEFWRLQAEEYAFEYPRTAVTFVHTICAQSSAMRFLFVCCLVLNLVVPLILFLHINEAQITILCQLLTFACAYWVYAKYDFVTAVFASQALLLPSIIYTYESFLKETSILEFIAVLGTYITSPRLWWDTSLLCYLWLCAALVLQVVCLTGGATIAYRGRA